MHLMARHKNHPIPTFPLLLCDSGRVATAHDTHDTHDNTRLGRHGTWRLDRTALLAMTT